MIIYVASTMDSYTNASMFLRNNELPRMSTASTPDLARHNRLEHWRVERQPTRLLTTFAFELERVNDPR